MDILQELSVDQWPSLQKKLKHLWPLNLPAYYTLYVNLKYPELREVFKFKIYCPEGNMDNGFVGLSVKNFQDILIFSITEDTREIEEAVLKTKVIDWNKMVFFDLVTSQTLPAIERIRDAMQFEKFDLGTAMMYHLAPTKLFTDMKLPANTYLTAVKNEHIHHVDDTWPYKNSYSRIYFTTLASNGLSYGLYSTKTEELLAWIFIKEYNYLCHLYCEEKHRRQGYGEYVMTCAVNDILKDGHDVYGYVVDDNKKPLSLFAKLGFKAVANMSFIPADKPRNKF